MTYVTAQIGTKPVLPEHMKPPARVAAVRARSEEEYGRLMRAHAARHARTATDEPLSPPGSRMTVCRRVAAIIGEAGEATARDIAGSLDITIYHARGCLRDLYKAGEVKRRAVLPKGAHSRHYVWSLVEGEG